MPDDLFTRSSGEGRERCGGSAGPKSQFSMNHMFERSSARRSRGAHAPGCVKNTQGLVGGAARAHPITITSETARAAFVMEPLCLCRSMKCEIRFCSILYTPVRMFISRLALCCNSNRFTLIHLCMYCIHVRVLFFLSPRFCDTCNDNKVELLKLNLI